MFAKIAFSLFGPPPDPEESNSTILTGDANEDDNVQDNPNNNEYADEQIAKVNNIQEKIVKHQSPTKVSSY